MLSCLAMGDSIKVGTSIVVGSSTTCIWWTCSIHSSRWMWNDGNCIRNMRPLNFGGVQKEGTPNRPRTIMLVKLSIESYGFGDSFEEPRQLITGLSIFSRQWMGLGEWDDYYYWLWIIPHSLLSTSKTMLCGGFPSPWNWLPSRPQVHSRLPTCESSRHSSTRRWQLEVFGDEHWEKSLLFPTGWGPQSS